MPPQQTATPAEAITTGFLVEAPLVHEVHPQLQQSPTDALPIEPLTATDMSPAPERVRSDSTDHSPSDHVYSNHSSVLTGHALPPYTTTQTLLASSPKSASIQTAPMLLPYNKYLCTCLSKATGTISTVVDPLITTPLGDYRV